MVVETAKRLSKRALFVYLGTRDLQEGQVTVKELAKEGFQNNEAIEIEVTKPNAISAAKNRMESEQDKLDILINTVGISGPYPRTTSGTTIEDIQKIFETDFLGAIRITQTFLELLKKSDSPCISNITLGLGSLPLHSDPE